MAASDHVGRVLGRVFSLSLAPVVGIGTCATIDTSGFNEVDCTEDGGTQYLERLKPASRADYLELRALPFVEGERPVTLEASGKPCARARDRAACEAEIAAATSTEGFQLGECVQICTRSFLVVNAGDEVEVVE